MHYHYGETAAKKWAVTILNITHQAKKKKKKVVKI